MIEIKTKDNQTNFSPGELIEFSVNWKFDTMSDIEVYLSWSTQGRGSTDQYCAHSQVLQSMGDSSGEEIVRIEAPIGPYSFSGKLISLVWHVGASGKSNHESIEQKIVIAPEKKEVNLLDSTKLLN